MGNYIIASSQKVFEGSADTQLFLVSEQSDQKFLVSFSGFLNSTSDDLDAFRVSELLLYQGNNVRNILATVKKRSEENIVTEHHSFRRFELNPGLKEKCVEWLFAAQVLESL